MAEPPQDKSLIIWRVAAGVLAVVAIGLGLLRLFAIALEGMPAGVSGFGYVLRVVFPLGIGLAFGYIAFSPRLWRRPDDGSDHGDQ